MNKVEQVSSLGHQMSLARVSLYSKVQCRGGSRILRRRGRQPSREGVPTYYFPKFSEKLHEIEKFWTVGGGRAGSAPPLDPPLQCPRAAGLGLGRGHVQQGLGSGGL